MSRLKKPRFRIKTKTTETCSILINNSSRTAKREQGYVLVVALLIFLFVTLIGVLALSTSILEVMIAGNTRLREVNLSTADSGVTVSEPVIRNPNRARYAFLSTAQEQYLRTELFCGSTLDPDTQNFAITVGDNNVMVDIDYVNAGDPSPGYAMEEGGPPILKKNYVINSTSTGDVGAQAVVGALYYSVGYCD